MTDASSQLDSQLGCWLEHLPMTLGVVSPRGLIELPYSVVAECQEQMCQQNKAEMHGIFMIWLRKPHNIITTTIYVSKQSPRSARVQEEGTQNPPLNEKNV